MLAKLIFGDLSMLDVNDIPFSGLLAVHAYYALKVLGIFLVCFYVLRLIIGFFVSANIKRKTKIVETEECEKVLDTNTNTYKNKWTTVEKEVVDKEAETPESLQEYHRQKALASIKAYRITACLFFLGLIAATLYHANYLGFQNFLVSEDDIESLLKVYSDFVK